MTLLWKCGCANQCRHTHRRVLIFVTNHSHEDTGDLFLAPTLCGLVRHVSGLSHVQLGWLKRSVTGPQLTPPISIHVISQRMGWDIVDDVMWCFGEECLQLCGAGWGHQAVSYHSMNLHMYSHFFLQTFGLECHHIYCSWVATLPHSGVCHRLCSASPCWEICTRGLLPTSAASYFCNLPTHQHRSHPCSEWASPKKPVYMGSSWHTSMGTPTPCAMQPLRMHQDVGIS